MAGLLQKLRTAVLSTAHELLDKVIDLNSVGAIKQHVRDLEEAMEDMQDAAAAETGTVRTIKHDILHLEARAAELDDNIMFLLSDLDETNDHLATPLQVRLDGINVQLEDKRAEFSEVSETARELNDAASKIEAKHAEMVERVRQLESLERRTDAKERATAAMRRAGATLSGVGGASVDDVAARLRQRSHVASAKFERVLGSFADSVDGDVALAQASTAIERRKAEIAAKRKAAAEKGQESDTPAEAEAPAS